MRIINVLITGHQPPLLPEVLKAIGRSIHAVSDVLGPETWVIATSLLPAHTWKNRVSKTIGEVKLTPLTILVIDTHSGTTGNGEFRAALRKHLPKAVALASVSADFSPVED